MQAMELKSLAAALASLDGYESVYVCINGRQVNIQVLDAYLDNDCFRIFIETEEE